MDDLGLKLDYIITNIRESEDYLSQKQLKLFKVNEYTSREREKKEQVQQARDQVEGELRVSRTQLSILEAQLKARQLFLNNYQNKASSHVQQANQKFQELKYKEGTSLAVTESLVRCVSKFHDEVRLDNPDILERRKVAAQDKQHLDLEETRLLCELKLQEDNKQEMVVLEKEEAQVQENMHCLRMGLETRERDLRCQLSSAQYERDRLDSNISAPVRRMAGEVTTIKEEQEYLKSALAAMKNEHQDLCAKLRACGAVVNFSIPAPTAPLPQDLMHDFSDSSNDSGMQELEPMSVVWGSGNSSIIANLQNSQNMASTSAINVKLSSNTTKKMTTSAKFTMAEMTKITKISKSAGIHITSRTKLIDLNSKAPVFEVDTDTSEDDVRMVGEVRMSGGDNQKTKLTKHEVESKASTNHFNSSPYTSQASESARNARQFASVPSAWGTTRTSGSGMNVGHYASAPPTWSNVKKSGNINPGYVTPSTSSSVSWQTQESNESWKKSRGDDVRGKQANPTPSTPRTFTRNPPPPTPPLPKKNHQSTLPLHLLGHFTTITTNTNSDDNESEASEGEASTDNTKSTCKPTPTLSGFRSGKSLSAVTNTSGSMRPIYSQTQQGTVGSYSQHNIPNKFLQPPEDALSREESPWRMLGSSENRGRGFNFRGRYNPSRQTRSQGNYRSPLDTQKYQTSQSSYGRNRNSEYQSRGNAGSRNQSFRRPYRSQSTGGQRHIPYHHRDDRRGHPQPRNAWNSRRQEGGWTAPDNANQQASKDTKGWAAPTSMEPNEQQNLGGWAAPLSFEQPNPPTEQQEQQNLGGWAAPLSFEQPNPPAEQQENSYGGWAAPTSFNPPNVQANQQNDLGGWAAPVSFDPKNSQSKQQEKDTGGWTAPTSFDPRNPQSNQRDPRNRQSRQQEQDKGGWATPMPFEQRNLQSEPQEKDTGGWVAPMSFDSSNLQPQREKDAGGWAPPIISCDTLHPAKTANQSSAPTCLTPGIIRPHSTIQPHTAIPPPINVLHTLSSIPRPPVHTMDKIGEGKRHIRFSNHDQLLGTPVPEK